MTGPSFLEGAALALAASIGGSILYSGLDQLLGPGLAVRLLIASFRTNPESIRICRAAHQVDIGDRVEAGGTCQHRAPEGIVDLVIQPKGIRGLDEFER